jgi:hypothetical protein
VAPAEPAEARRGDHTWIVGGAQLVIDTFSMPGATADEISQREDVIGSIRFGS